MTSAKLSLVIACLSSLTLIACLLVLPVRVPDLVQAKKDVVRYVTSQRYHKDLQRAANKGLYWLNQGQAEQQAVVFDIDETVLSNYQQMKKNGFGGTSQLFRAQDLEGKAVVMQPIYKVYQKAIAQGYHVFFITGRRPEARAATVKNLKKEGYLRWEKIFFLPEHSNQTVTEYKTSMRVGIEKKGYQIVLNVGDQYSDLKGGHAMYRLKLPNPFYLIPSTHRR